MDKKKVHVVLTLEINHRIKSLNDLLQDAMDTTSGETKSSAGDKHETSRAMAQIEQDKIGRQLFEMQKIKELLARINPDNSSPTINLGSLIETTNGWFFISVGIGAIMVEKETVFCMTLAAPLGKLLYGKKVGDTIEWQGEKIEIMLVK